MNCGSDWSTPRTLRQPRLPREARTTTANVWRALRALEPAILWPLSPVNRSGRLLAAGDGAQNRSRDSDHGAGTGIGEENSVERSFGPAVLAGPGEAPVGAAH